MENQGVLIVANHTSYFDILVFSAWCPSRSLRARCCDMALVGTLAKLQETVFVERTRRAQTGAARDQIRERLLAGDTLVLFPEGTSDDGNCVLPFKSALMGAVEAEIGTDESGRVRHVPVQPVSISYVALHGMPMGRENRPLFAWYGDMDLVPHLWEAAKAGPIDVVVEFHPPMIRQHGRTQGAGERCGNHRARGQTRALAGWRSRKRRRNRRRWNSRLDGERREAPLG